MAQTWREWRDKGTKSSSAAFSTSDSYQTIMKKYFKELETGKRFSQRSHLFKNGQYRKLEKKSLDYTWLVGDDLVLAFMLHKEEGFPIAHGRRLLSYPEDGSPEN
eukprot:gene4310-4879_t